MTDGRKLQRGANSRTALVDFIKKDQLGDPRVPAVRLAGDPLDQALGAVAALGSEHVNRRYRPNTFQGSVEHQALHARRQEPNVEPVSMGDDNADLQSRMEAIRNMDPRERDLMEKALDSVVAEELGSTATFEDDTEPTFDYWGNEV